MATHSCIFAWRIRWTEEPEVTQSMGRRESDMTEVTEHFYTHVLFHITFHYRLLKNFDYSSLYSLVVYLFYTL